MEQLIKGKTSLGKWYVRPVTWAGIWNAKGELVGCNTLFIADTEGECIEYINREKLKELNKLEAVDWSISGDECEYVLVDNTENNKRVLKELGADEEDIISMIEDDLIEISYFAFSSCGADWYCTDTGFGIGEYNG